MHQFTSGRLGPRRPSLALPPQPSEGAGPSGDAEGSVPTLRALALLRTGDEAGARWLLRQTLAAAHTGELWLPPEREPLAALLARQRAVFNAVGPGPTARLRRAPWAGASLIWARLHRTMATLLDVEREALFLVDGGACRWPVLADSLGCRQADVVDLVQTARAELLAELHATCDRRGWPRSDAMPSCRDIEDDVAFCRHLNMALYRSLMEATGNAARLEALRQMIEEEAKALAPSRPSPSPRPTRWLRLMFIAYARGTGT